MAVEVKVAVGGTGVFVWVAVEVKVAVGGTGVLVLVAVKVKVAVGGTGVLVLVAVKVEVGGTGVLVLVGVGLDPQDGNWTSSGPASEILKVVTAAVFDGALPLIRQLQSKVTPWVL